LLLIVRFLPPQKESSQGWMDAKQTKGKMSGSDKVSTNYFLLSCPPSLSLLFIHPSFLSLFSLAVTRFLVALPSFFWTK
jgi:hypothetical protein